MNGAALIAEILKREGTGFLSCYPRNPLIEACAALDIRTILCRQERVGVGIADGYSRISRANGPYDALRRCRAASYSTMLPATPAFKDSTWAACGIVISSSTCASTSRLKPEPSLPTKIATGAVRFP